MSDVKLNQVLRRQKNLQALALMVPAAYTGLLVWAIGLL
jgi:short subunit fatty acids transporter